MARKTIGGEKAQRGQAVKAETTVAQVLEDAKKTDFQDPAAVRRFQEAHQARLNKTPNTIYTKDEPLHEIAKEDNLGPYKKFVKWAVKNYRPLLFCKTLGGYTTLHLALEGNHEFVGLVLQYVDNVQELLAEKTDLDKTCLHLAIEHRSPFTEEIIATALGKPGQGASAPSGGAPGSGANASKNGIPDIFTVQSKGQPPDDDEMTPLHVAVMQEINDENDGRFLDQGPLPPSNAKSQGIPSKKPVGDGDAADKFVMVNRGLQRAPTLDFKVPASPIGPQASKHEEDLLRGAKRFNLPVIVQKLVEANHRVLVDYENAGGNTPFQALAEFDLEEKKSEFAALKTEAQREALRHKIIEGDNILTYLRKYIIETFDRRDAMKALYKIGDERVLEFDLSGLPYSTINSEFLYGLGKVLRFEGLLKYVALPRLTVEDEEAIEIPGGPNGSKLDQEQGGKGNPGGGGAGLQHMYTIFQWLRRHHVQSVLKVSVIDDAEPSHSDEAIEECLKRLDVRIWNWYRVDLCVDVIVNAAPNAKDVTLYSSGSNAVLVGWSSSAGLPRLQQLEKVHVYVQEGLERPKRLEGYMKTFKEELLKHKPELKCTWELRKPDSNYNSIFVERGGEKVTESKWMRTMEDFAGFLQTVKPSTKIEPIKIAIIDDGIDTSLDDFTDKIQVGESFYQLSELFGRRGAYYVPTGKHGTLMAQSICKVCPVVKLYIAQLEVLPGQNGQRSFTAESATEAINWAVGRGVDIISMSWSINSRSTVSGLEDALQLAASKRIIMFCAAIDEGPSAVDKTYPGRVAGCIKIGASTGSGAKLSWVPESSQFLLPGEAPYQAADSSRYSSQNQQHPYMGSFGSSVSTALAAGLAGVLLYCDRLLESENIHTTAGGSGVSGANGAQGGAGAAPLTVPGGAAVGGPGSTGSGDNPTHVDELRTLNKMTEAFQMLAKGTEQNKFLQVQEHFPTNPKSLVWNQSVDPEGTAKTKTELEAFMKLIKR